MKRIIIMLLVALGFAAGAKAQTQTIPDDAFGNEVKAVIDLTLVDNNFADMFYDLMKVQIGDKLPDEKLRPMCQELADALIPAVYYAAYKAYVDIFTLDEMKQIHAFYKTSAGQKLAKNLSKINSVSTEVMTSPETQKIMSPIIMKYVF